MVPTGDWHDADGRFPIEAVEHVYSINSKVFVFLARNQEFLDFSTWHKVRLRRAMILVKVLCSHL